MATTTETHSIDEIRTAIAIEREILAKRSSRDWTVPVDEIRARAGFYPNNDERSRLEVANFRADPPGPYFAYKTGATIGKTITTWTGAELARVIEVGYPYRSNFGDRRLSFRAIGINGAVYAGTAYIDAGDYVRMRPVKATKREAAKAAAYAQTTE